MYKFTLCCPPFQDEEGQPARIKTDYAMQTACCSPENFTSLYKMSSLNCLKAGAINEIRKQSFMLPAVCFKIR